MASALITSLLLLLCLLLPFSQAIPRPQLLGKMGELYNNLNREYKQVYPSAPSSSNPNQLADGPGLPQCPALPKSDGKAFDHPTKGTMLTAIFYVSGRRHFDCIMDASSGASTLQEQSATGVLYDYGRWLAASGGAADGAALPPPPPRSEIERHAVRIGTMTETAMRGSMSGQGIVEAFTLGRHVFFQGVSRRSLRPPARARARAHQAAATAPADWEHLVPLDFGPGAVVDLDMYRVFTRGGAVPATCDGLMDPAFSALYYLYAPLGYPLPMTAEGRGVRPFCTAEAT
ncbi:MAG: hypothetical protein M1826_006025 [Phylliscum demangeonii]|nr:MAG: hypothetical protein M1826_006025 [Phylliscum demangeonii]